MNRRNLDSVRVFIFEKEIIDFCVFGLLPQGKYTIVSGDHEVALGDRGDWNLLQKKHSSKTRCITTAMTIPLQPANLLQVFLIL